MFAHLLRRPLLRLLPLVYLDNDGTVNTLAAASRSLRGIAATSVKGDGDRPREIATDVSLRIFPSPLLNFRFSLSLFLFFFFLLCTLYFNSVFPITETLEAKTHKPQQQQQQQQQR